MTQTRLLGISLVAMMAKLMVVALLGVGALAGAETFGDGTYMVGQEIQPGAYEATGGESCVWFLHRGGNQYVTSLSTDSDVVEILGSDLAFHTERCGTWRSVAEPTESAALPDPAELVLAVLAASITILVSDRAVVENIQQRTHEMVYATLRSPRYAGVASQVMPAIKGHLLFLQRNLGLGSQ